MADSITSGSTLNIGLEYDDEGTTKTIYIKLPNPKDNLTESEIRTQTNAFINEQVVLDPNGNPFSTSSVATAYTLAETKYKIDLE